MFFGFCENVGNRIDAFHGRVQSYGRCWRNIVHKGRGDIILRVSVCPLVDAIFDTASGNISRGKLTVWKYDFSFAILLALAIVDIRLAD